MFWFTEEQKKIKSSVREFAVRKVAPLAQRVDKEQEIPLDIRKEMAQQGYLGRIMPKEVGGLGHGMVEFCIQSEELAWGSTAIAASTVASMLSQIPVMIFGSQEQVKRFSGPIARGEGIGSIGLTEPKHGSDFASLESSAVRDGNEYVLNGSKLYVDNTSVSQFFTVWVKTDVAAKPQYKGISTFVVERDRPGFKVDMVDDLIGLRGLGVGGFSYEDCRVPVENRIGEEGQGFYHAMSLLERGRTAAAAVTVGLAQAALDAAKDFAKKRIQFGKPIAEFQAMQWYIADMATAIEAARLLVFNAAKLIDNGGRNDREASMAKIFASDMCVDVTYKAVQIHGGRGCTKEWPVERMYRDSRIFTVGEGTVEMQRIIISRRELESN